MNRNSSNILFNKYILITGATGFLGSHILDYMIKNTEYKFIALKRVNSKLDKIKFLSNDIPRQIFSDIVTFIDVETPACTNLDEIFSSYNICAVIHCATDYGRNKTSCMSVIDSNIIFPIRLLESAIKFNVDLFINTDSYFNKPNFTYNYLQNYSLSKKSLNLWLRYFSNKIKIANCILEHMYGELDSINKFTSFLISEIAIKNSPSIDLTYGDQKRDFIYIQDVVSAYKVILDFCLNNKIKYRDFEIGTGISTSVKEFASTVKQKAKSNTMINFGVIPYREDEIFISVAENSSLLNLGWQPKYNIKEGIEKYINYEKIINCDTYI